MPEVRKVGAILAGAKLPATYTVKSGDSLWSIAARTLGKGDRWGEIYNLNRGVIGSSPANLRSGLVLRLPGGAQPAPAPEPKPPAPEPKPSTLGKDYGDFANRRARELQAQGVEIDCADFAVKLYEDFSKEKGLPNPFAGRGKWSVYTPGRSGGLPNVNGPNYFRSVMGADNLAKEYTKPVNDADGNGIAGFDRTTGKVDTADLRPGDILFYDWDQNGEVNHTVNVLSKNEDGSITLGFGTYDNTGPEGSEVTWATLDLSPVQIEKVEPGSERWEHWFGAGSQFWGARRCKALPDERRPAADPVAAAPAPKSETPASGPIASAPKSETPASGPIAPAPKSETPASGPIAPAPKPETPGVRPVQAYPEPRPAGTPRPLGRRPRQPEATMGTRWASLKDFLLGA